MNNELNQPMNQQVNQSKTESKRSNWKLFLVIAVCAAPMLLSYLAYYVIKPSARTNYGTLLDPRAYPMPHLNSALFGGPSQELSAYKGKWIMLQVSSSDCASACQKTLLNMRQLRLMQGKDMERIERVILVTDTNPIDTLLLREFDGTHFMHADAKVIKNWLPAEERGDQQDRIYLIDPLGNLMMRYPVDADPYKVNKDLVKLLKASSIG